MSEIEKIKQERSQNMKDVFNNTIPKRVPIDSPLGMNVIAGYAGVDARRAYWNYELLADAADELCKMIPSDISPAKNNFFNPAKAQSLDALSSKMGADGFMQHPNTHMMEPEEYKDFIKDPYKFITQTAIPRIYKNLDFNNNPDAASTMYKAVLNEQKASASFRALNARLSEKYGFPDKVRGGGGYMAFDILTDELRSFSGMLTDIRRHRSEVSEAVEAVYPLNYKHSMPNMKTYTREAYCNYAFHMATYMRIKDFESLWWKAFMKEANDFASIGVRCGGFLETDWTAYIDYLQDLPTGSVLKLEYGDPVQFKERLGKKHILTSGFPLGYITQLSKQECIDKTKEWLDIMAPGGQYIFDFDKAPLSFADINIDTLKAVIETVKTYGVYDNAGEACGEIFNQSDYTCSNTPEFSSEAYMTWERYLEKFPDTPDDAKTIIESTEDDIFNFYYSLLM